ncbi:MAG: septum formation initiator family protein [Pyrinomonadaceae bacterium]|nr:septum formation initiator family protein [Pyrinomonadaceae bacterium]
MPVYAPGRVEIRERIRSRALQSRSKSPSRLMIFCVLVALTFAFCVTLGIKTRSEMNRELNEQNQYQIEIDKLQKNNSALIDETRLLQSDPTTIERAARQRLNMAKSNERITVSKR